MQDEECTVHKLLYDEKLCDLTVELHAPECEDPNALIESGDPDWKGEKTTVRNLESEFVSSKKEVLKLNFFYDEKLSDFTAEPGSPKCDNPNALIGLDEQALEDEGTTGRSLESRTRPLDENLEEFTKECLSPSYVGPKDQY